MRQWLVSLFCLVCFLSFASFSASSSEASSSKLANALPEIRVGVLKFGTVNWEIDVIKHHQLDKKYHFKLSVKSLSSKNASSVALQSNAVDIILSDWLWVNRQRSENKYYTLYPMSKATGGLYVKKNSGIESLTDLKEKKIGISGGAVDKTWLLLQAFSQKKYGFDLQKQTEPTFAVPPLINQLMLREDLTAAINFWHYGARLKAKGFHSLVTHKEILSEFGVDADVPLLGWVFEQNWAKNNNDALNGFLQASLEAKQILASSDQEWLRIKPLLKVENTNVYNQLKKDYRAGILAEFGESEVAASHLIFDLLLEQGGRSLVGKATELNEGTFWPVLQKELKDKVQASQ